MKLTTRANPRLETLEDRFAPAINVLQTATLLNISGTLTTGVLTLSTTATPGQLTVSDVGPGITYSNVSSVSVNLGASAGGNVVLVDLNLNSLNGNLSINAGTSANNAVFVTDNLAGPATDILGNLTISRANTVNLGSLEVLGSVTINNSGYTPSIPSSYIVGEGDITGSLNITGTSGRDDVGISTVAVGGNLTVNLGTNAGAPSQNVSIDNGTTVQGFLSVIGGAGGTSVTLDATVNRNVTVNLGNTGLGGNSLEFTAGSFVGGDMSVTMGTASAAVNGNQVSLDAGTINGNLTISLGKSNANQIDYAAIVNGRTVNIVYQMGINVFNLNPGASLTNPLGRMSLYMAKGGSNTFNTNTPIDWPMYVSI